MIATLLLVIAFFAIAMLGLGIGVILNKKTPLKGSCRGAVDGTGGACSCHEVEGGGCGRGTVDEDAAIDDFKNGHFTISI